jgi:hypothetical protein
VNRAASGIVAVSEVAVNLAYVVAALALVAMAVPGFRWWVRSQVRQMVYEFQMAEWRRTNAPAAAIFDQLRRPDLPDEEGRPD